ncbi:DMT family transporter [Sneathiella marina]|uniref:DMT family transporter n=1 Tax=Sneathiella marina TaxID=2950108 RepID=A0ABY4WA36_9PROT|nr:DMT family transporter [Sneathiella marina]USG61511.1 DMT family transporter [Sneathiella marina]
MTTSLPARLQPYLLLAIGGACLGSFAPLSKIGLRAGIPPVSYMFYAALGASAGLLIWTCVTRKVPSLAPASLIYYAISALLTFVIPSLATVIIVEEIGAGLVAISFTLVPVLTYVFAVVLKLELFRRLRALGVLLGLAGAVIIYLPGTTLIDSEGALWTYSALIIPLSLATGGIFRTIAWPKGASASQLATGTLSMSAIMLLPILFWRGEAYWPFYLTSAADWIMVFQILTAFISYLILFELQKSQGVVFQSLIGYVSTMTGVFVGFFIYGEDFTYFLWFALLLMVCGMALVNRQKVQT